MLKRRLMTATHMSLATSDHGALGTLPCEWWLPSCSSLLLL